MVLGLAAVVRALGLATVDYRVRTSLYLKTLLSGSCKVLGLQWSAKIYLLGGRGIESAFWLGAVLPWRAIASPGQCKCKARKQSLAWERTAPLASLRVVCKVAFRTSGG